MQELVYLIGPRAAGKTTLGLALSASLGLSFSDADIYLQEKLGQSVAQVVQERGWPHFRALESAFLRELSRPHTVLATGGGAVLDPDNRAFMRANGLVLYLEAPVAELARRLGENPDPSQRPPLTGAGLEEEVSQVLAQRADLYRECAHHILAAGNTPAEVLLEASGRIRPAS